MNTTNFDLDTPLFKFSADPSSPSFTVRHSVEGIGIMGGIGSGKSSGSGRLIAQKFLKAGYGGLVLTAKPDEANVWKEYCKNTGREHDLIIVEPGSGYYFNFLQYESSGHASISYTDNIFQVLKTVIKAGQQRSSGGGDDSFFWESALDMVMLNVIDLCMLAHQKITVPLLYEIAQTAPKKASSYKSEGTAFQVAFDGARKKVKKRIDEWRNQIPADTLNGYTEDAYEQMLEEHIQDYRQLKMTIEFFTDGLYNIPDKTRSIIDFSFSGALFRLLRDPIYSLFCRYPSNYTPEDSLNGKIIVLNIPVKTFNAAGQFAQLMFKYIWQRAMERRNINENGRPVFLWADEAQLFLHEHDSEYQATARSSRIATVYISQNLANYYSNMGGEGAHYRVVSLLGTLGTKVFHANADPESNEWASSLIGSAYFPDHSRSTQVSGEFSVSKSLSYKLERIVRPEEFGRLKSGGPNYDFKVYAYVHMQSQQLQNGFNHQLICFNQKSKS